MQDVCEKYYKLNEEFCLWLINELKSFHINDIKRIEQTANSFDIELPEIYKHKLYALQLTSKITL